MSTPHPIRIVPMGDDAYAITGLAQCDVQVHVAYRVNNNPKPVQMALW